MKKIVLKSFRKLYFSLFGRPIRRSIAREEDPDKISTLIFNLLSKDDACMVARFGSTELTTLVNYLGVINSDRNIWKYISGQTEQWWWNNEIFTQMQQWSGFFPPTQDKIEQFCELMIQDMPFVDILGSWMDIESFFANELVNSQKVAMPYFVDPFFTEKPWTKALEGKKVLVVHPFANTIQEQYTKREYLFKNKDILPLFELKTIKAVQSIAGEKTEFSDWFEALDWMKNEIDKTEYDICLLGCGAYGFPLAAHIKRKGRKALHIGGSLQLLFGIKGARWDASRGFLYNEYWVRPSESERPKELMKVENGCYW